MVKVKAFELREKSEGKLLKELDDLKKELLQLRVSEAIGAQAPKLAKIKLLRKSIARVLTVHNEKRRAAAKALYEGKKYVPKDLRKKTTRAMRRKLTPEQRNKKTVK